MNKMNVTFDRKTQVDDGSDGAAVNKALFKDEQDELGPHLINGCFANHKSELGIYDSFKDYFKQGLRNHQWSLRGAAAA